MFSDYNIQTRKMLIGNLLLIVCCVFYLAWWLIAFKPEGAIKGFKSGWLLIPAVIFGGIAVYVILLLATAIFMKRQVTTELLIVIVMMAAVTIGVVAS